MVLLEGETWHWKLVRVGGVAVRIRLVPDKHWLRKAPGDQHYHIGGSRTMDLHVGDRQRLRMERTGQHEQKNQFHLNSAYINS